MCSSPLFYGIFWNFRETPLLVLIYSFTVVVYSHFELQLVTIFSKMLQKPTAHQPLSTKQQTDKVKQPAAEHGEAFKAQHFPHVLVETKSELKESKYWTHIHQAARNMCPHEC